MAQTLTKLTLAWLIATIETARAGLTATLAKTAAADWGASHVREMSNHEKDLHIAAQVLRLPDILVRGNATEMAALSFDLAAAKGVTRVTTGKIDRIEGEAASFAVAHGHKLMTKVTGIGCAAGALIAACCAVEANKAVAAAAALTAYGIAGEIAAERCRGPGSFEVELIDAVAAMDAATLAARMGTGR